MERTVAAVPEEVVRLRVNGVPVASWTCTPDAHAALAAGRLLALGYIRSAEELLDLRIAPVDAEAGGGVVLAAQVAPERAAAGDREREHRREHGCGPSWVVTCGRAALPTRDPISRVPPVDALPELFRALFDRSRSRRSAGGHHTAALVRDGALVHLHEEVGRHNAVDKALGAALLAGDDPATLGLVTTARISGEIAEKCARAGVGWIASRSVPTSLAVAIASAAGVPVVGRAASPEARTFGPGDPSPEPEGPP